MGNLINTILKIKNKGYDIAITDSLIEEDFITNIVISKVVAGVLFRQEFCCTDEALREKGTLGLDDILIEMFNIVETLQEGS